MLPHFIPYSTQNITESDKDALIEALFSSHLTQGCRVQRFEENIATFLHIKHAIACNSATSALYMAFAALKEFIRQDEFMQDSLLADSMRLKKARDSKKYSIITTPISFVATSNMMLANDIIPIFADITMDGNLDPKSLESYLREDTIAICSVDYAGKSVERDSMRAFANQHKILWISDSSHAFGAEFYGEKIGGREINNTKTTPAQKDKDADISIFSFHAVKPFTTCEGGVLVTQNDYFANIARLICSHGIEKKSFHNHDCIRLGFNFRMHELSAALGISQLQRLESFLIAREKIARFYDDYFKDNPYFYTPKIQHYQKSTRHLYPLLLDSKYLCMKESLINALITQNIGVQVHYKPIYHFLYYKQLESTLGITYPLLHNAEDFYHAQLSIPCHQNMNLDTAKQVAERILQTFEKIC
ncbi:DegT/DnrJ/EryC1/StrS family aminotransferase [Helicobacter sp. MIT 14-3879]|uniref:DegT/DnrJ/EryC1/StrS family aminotransferase n=1 Tax=Helicobacter sp. MIT 14-3879 TaxID=2040649 RepID=UPI000E1E33EC|nr:DegT/DnrJ/EryC1/StrS family aminotransferase [Helicobacter sp. MIT 14-3879]RDU61206.1 hypothetical protein CQA44_09805 [Helicobacter sp. MIT 14-3879]